MEEWRAIGGFNGRYEVSNLGNVRNAMTKNVLSQRKHDGYKRINLYMNSADEKGTTKSVHRLVADAFLPNPLNLPCINHRDENPSNNVVSNLEWSSVRYNNCYGTVLKRKAASRRGHCVRAVQQCKDGVPINEFASIREAADRTGTSASSICKVLRGVRGTAGGWQWKYA